MQKFTATIEIIGVNPYVLLPENDLKEIQRAAGYDKGPIPVKGTLNGKPFIQTLVKYAGLWRLYLNTPMREATGTKVGDTVTFEVEFDKEERVVPVPVELADAFARNKTAKEAFEKLPPYRQKELNRYIGSLKSDEIKKRNVEKVIYPVFLIHPHLYLAVLFIFIFKKYNYKYIFPFFAQIVLSVLFMLLDYLRYP